MALEDLLWQIPVVVLVGYAGMAFHELCHYSMGWLAGGKPEFERYWFGIPTQVDFLSPESMSNFEIRLTGGIVILWPLAAFLLIGYLIGTGKSEVFLPIVFFSGAGVVSWLDLLATTHPDVWRTLTNGDSIDRSMLEE